MAELDDATLTAFEPDIQAKARSWRSAISGYDEQDLAQEFRLAIWEKWPAYDPSRSSSRTYAQRVMRWKLSELWRKSMKGKLDYTNRS
jgi:DNA-directed RNA polymerase specialized sigma24 family protein